MYVWRWGEVNFLIALGVAERAQTAVLDLKEAEFDSRAHFKELERTSSPPHSAFSLVNRRGQSATFSAICA